MKELVRIQVASSHVIGPILLEPIIVFQNTFFCYNYFTNYLLPETEQYIMGIRLSFNIKK